MTPMRYLWAGLITVVVVAMVGGGLPSAVVLRDPMPPVQAIVGRPLTPVSVAGVARRTTRRTIAYTSAYVAALPVGCIPVNVEGTPLYQCGATYYAAQGAQYVVVNVN